MFIQNFVLRAGGVTLLIRRESEGQMAIILLSGGELPSGAMG